MYSIIHSMHLLLDKGKGNAVNRMFNVGFKLVCVCVCMCMNVCGGKRFALQGSVLPQPKIMEHIKAILVPLSNNQSPLYIKFQDKTWNVQTS